MPLLTRGRGYWIGAAALLLLIGLLIWGFQRRSQAQAHAHADQQRQSEQRRVEELARQKVAAQAAANTTAGKPPGTATPVQRPADPDETENRAPAPGTVVYPPSAGRGPENLPDTAGGRALRTHMASLDFAGPTAQKRFDESLRELRKYPREAIDAAHTAYQQAPKGDYLSRNAYTQVLGQVDSHDATDALIDIASEPIPAGLTDSHRDTRLESEGLIRFAAIRALGELAARGDQRALAALEALIKNGHPTIRVYAAQVYVEALGYSRQARQHAASLLPEQDRPSVEARGIPPGETPMPEPRLRKPVDLSGADRKKEKREWQE